MDNTHLPTPQSGSPDDVTGLHELDAGERGFVLAVVLANETEEVIAVTAALGGGPSARRCQRVACEIAALARPARLRLLGQLARASLAPIPAGIEHVDQEILRHLLRGESAAVIAVLAAQAPPLSRLRQVAEEALAGSQAVSRSELLTVSQAQAAMVAELQRAVLAPIVAVPPVSGDVLPQRLGRRLATSTSAALMGEMTAAGADLLGISLRGADDETLARAVVQLAGPWSQLICDSARLPPRLQSNEGAVAPSHARALVAATSPAADPGRTLERLGARALGDRLGQEDSQSVPAVAQRLPADLRRELLKAAAGVTPTCESG